MTAPTNATLKPPADPLHAYSYGWSDAEGELLTSDWYVSPEAMLKRLCPEALAAERRGMLLHPITPAEAALADRQGVVRLREDLSLVTVRDSTLVLGRSHPGVHVTPVG